MVEHVRAQYNQITDFIYIGTNYCCQIHFENDLLEKGIRADISLEAERLDSPFGVDFFLWLPTIDHEAPSLHALRLGARTLDYCEKENIPVYVHCMNGHGRSPALVAGYFIAHKGMTVNEAIDFIRSKREEIHIEDVQIAQLQKYYDEVNA